MFFEKEENKRALEEFVEKSSACVAKGEGLNSRLSDSIKIIKSINENPNKWSEQCDFNIKDAGDKFIKSLISFDGVDCSSIDNIYTMAHGFLCEYAFYIGQNSIGPVMFDIMKRVPQNIDGLSDSDKSYITFSCYLMPARIIKLFLQDENVDFFRKFESKIVEAGKLKSSWDEDLKKKSDQVDSLKNRLDEYKTGFNFVGLEKGFSNLLIKKKRESFWFKVGISLFGFSLIAIPISFVFGVLCFKAGGGGSIDPVVVLPSAISIEFVFIYFFRIALSGHKSVKAQIIQLELRSTLCQFIQSYSEYSSKIKKDDASALEKFENLIFSGIVSDPEKLPSTFDGLDQLGGLIKSLKK